MKKRIAMVLAAALLLCGCARQTAQTAETTAPETTQPETTQPETTVPETKPLPKLETGTIQADGIPLVLTLLDRGDSVEVLRWTDETHAWVKAGEQEGTVEKQLLRMANEEAYSQWNGYAMYSAVLYLNYRLTGEGEALPLNTKLQVLEELDECYMVAREETLGFVAKKAVSRYPAGTGGSSGGEDSGSSGGGGSASGGGGGQDGGDISLAVPGRLNLLADEVITGPAQIKADGAELVADTLALGSQVDLLAEKDAAPELEGYAAVYLGEDGFAYVPEQWVLREGETFEPWEGYAGYNCQLFDNYLLQGQAVRWLYVNTKVTVLWETDQVLLVQAGETVGYVAAETVRTTPVAVAPSDGGESSGGGGGGSSSGGGGGDWTPPML